MLTKEKVLLTSVGKDPYFKKIIEKLTKGHKLETNENTFILSCAILFLKSYELDKRFTAFADFSYYIILKYSLKTKHFEPLLDFAVNFGFYPISNVLLQDQNTVDLSISNFLVNVNHDRFKSTANYVKTIEQHNTSETFLDDKANQKSYLAPTSFGKSAIIVNYLEKLKGDQRIAIVVPTRSLLMQTYQMIRDAQLRRKIIIHDEMYNDEDSFIAVFTQERALRLLNRKEIFYDVIIVDEAHNLLNNDSRSILLARLISKNGSLNKKQKVIYLSPLVSSVENLKVPGSPDISSHEIKFNIKEPDIHEYHADGSISIYNRFVNQHFENGQAKDKFTYLIKNSGDKNFIYNYRPIKIEMLAKELSTRLPEIDKIQSITDVEQILKREVHKDFYAIKYLKYGLIYIHGKLPDLIKGYLEYKFNTIPEIKYIIANSVILEGMNLPIDTLFIFNTRGLKGKEMINLIGRVNRLNNIFSTTPVNLSKLCPQIHFINNEEHNQANGNMSHKISQLRSRIFEDIIENPVLENFDIEKLPISKTALETYTEKVKLIQANEKFISQVAKTEAAKLKSYLIESGLNEFYHDVEKLVTHLIGRMKVIESKKPNTWETLSILNKIHILFIENIDYISDGEVRRLTFEEARNYYDNFIIVTQKKALNENITSQTKFFKEKARSNRPILYFGRSYGEIAYNSESKDINSIDLASKNDTELINLAIVKLKMEEDFISFKLNKFIVMMYDYELITADEYNLCIYGTTDERKIGLTKYGLSISLISRLDKDGQINNLSFDQFNNLKGNAQFDEFLASVNDFYRFEISRYLN